MKKICLFIFLGLILSLPNMVQAENSGSCQGNQNIYVSTMGSDGNTGTRENPFRSILRAVKVAKRGDAILVQEGQYAEGEEGEFRSLVISQPDLKLCSVSGQGATVVPKDNHFKVGLHILADGILIDGIHLSGFRDALVQIGDQKPIQGITLKNMRMVAKGDGSKDGIATYDTPVDRLNLYNVTVQDAYIGIQCNQGPCRHWRLEKVKVRNDRGQGDTGSDGIAVEKGEDIYLKDVEVSNAAGDGVDLKAKGVTLVNAYIHDNARNGVKFWQGGSMINALVVNHGADATVVFDGKGDYLILNSTVAYQNYPQGGSYTMTVGYDYPKDPIELAIINSVFFNNAGAIWVSPQTKLTLKNCLFTLTANGELVMKGERVWSFSDPAQEIQAIATASGIQRRKATGLVKGPPGDFTFLATSPLKDSGLRVPYLPGTDLVGHPRIQGKGPDLGPLELF